MALLNVTLLWLYYIPLNAVVVNSEQRVTGTLVFVMVGLSAFMASVLKVSTPLVVDVVLFKQFYQFLQIQQR